VLTFLLNIVEVISFIPKYILFAIETLWNDFVIVIQGAFELATSLIELPAEPVPPEFIEEINWFLPIGAIISIITPVVTGYILFLAVRWVYKWSGNL
jgi:hypothetical protein